MQKPNSSQKVVNSSIIPIKKETKKERKTQSRKYRALVGGKEIVGGSSAKLALRASRYLQSILDPLKVPGAKIPDEITVPSFTCQLITKFSLVVQAGNGSGGSPNGIGVSRFLGTISTGLQPFLLLTPTAGAPQYTATAMTGTWTGGTSLTGVANMTRLVSAEIVVQAQGASNTNQGRLLVGFIPPNDILGSLLTTTLSTSLTTILAGAYMTEVAAAEGGMARAIYLPTDDLSRTYVQSGLVAQTPARGNTNSPTYGGLFAIWDGGDTSPAAAVEFIIVENYEVIPVSSAANILNPTASHSDPLELAAAANFLSANPRAAVHQPVDLQRTQCLDSGRMVKTDSEGPSFLDSVLSGIGKGLNFAVKAAPVAAELLAML